MSDQLERTLWAFSLTVYSREGVREECLDLQEQFGIDVNLLLFCAFLGAGHGVMLTHTDVVEARNSVNSWHADIVIPLRKVRRRLKPWGIDTSSLMAVEEQFREKIKTVELESERIEQAMLAQWAAPRLNTWPRGEPGNAIRINIASLLSAYVAQDQTSSLPEQLIGAAALATARTG